jgi:hypothetical protein
MFKAVYSSDMQSLKHLGYRLWASGNKPAALLCFDHLFSDPNLSELEMGTGEQAISSLELFYIYACLMQQVITHRKPWDSAGIRKLFAFYPASEDYLILRHGTFVHDCYRGDDSQTENDLKVSCLNFWQFFNVSLIARLRNRMLVETKICLCVHVFDPCPSTGFRGQCNKNGCRLVHKLDVAWYNRRARFHFKQIMVLHTFQTLPHAVDFPTCIWERRYVCRYWCFTLLNTMTLTETG